MRTSTDAAGKGNYVGEGEGRRLWVGEQDKRDALLRNQNGLGPEIESWGCCTQWQAVASSRSWEWQGGMIWRCTPRPPKG